ncbi:RNA polymerase subunit RPO7 [Cetacean poxvirus 1]|nr:RNA polymerase subunit RPO7 [Cetacean poxvirus 1]
MVYQLICSSCGIDLSEVRYYMIVKNVELKVIIKNLNNYCCRLKICTQIEPQRNLTVQPLLDIN